MPTETPRVIDDWSAEAVDSTRRMMDYRLVDTGARCELQWRYPDREAWNLECDSRDVISQLARRIVRWVAWARPPQVAP